VNHNGTEAHIKELSVLSNVDVRTTEDEVTVLVVPWAIGPAWHASNLALTGIGLANTIKTCLQNEGQPDNFSFCVTGLVSTMVGVGGGVSAAKKFAESRAYLGVAANAWMQSDLELIDLREFARDLTVCPPRI
jgi:hypothetical protein